MKIEELAKEGDLEILKDEITKGEKPKCEFCGSDLVYEASDEYWKCPVCR